MISPNNCHDLFQHANKHTLLSDSKLRAEDDRLLKSVSKELKQIIRAGFEDHKLLMKSRGLVYELPSPHFRTQGSYVYKTIIDPAYPPAQQVDLDLGVYLPFENLLGSDGPSESAKTYFDIIAAIISSHGKWDPKIKSKCIRIFVNERVHIDLPLYGIPAEEFRQVKAIELKNKQRNMRNSLVDLEDSLPITAELNCIHLALSSGNWTPSDPLMIINWVYAVCSEHGMKNAIRPLCKYLKAWRDERWQGGGGPSSIFLLACVLHNYRHTDSHHHNLLLEIINVLPDCLNHPVLVPAPSADGGDFQEDLRDRIDAVSREKFKAAFDELKQQYSEAMTTTDLAGANRLLIGLFGPRLPFDPDRIVRVRPPAPRDKVTSTPAVVAPIDMGSESSGG